MKIDSSNFWRLAVGIVTAARGTSHVSRDRPGHLLFDRDISPRKKALLGGCDHVECWKVGDVRTAASRTEQESSLRITSSFFACRIAASEYVEEPELSSGLIFVHFRFLGSRIRIIVIVFRPRSTKGGRCIPCRMVKPISITSLPPGSRTSSCVRSRS
jgi:hypothetical protein